MKGWLYNWTWATCQGIKKLEETKVSEWPGKIRTIGIK